MVGISLAIQISSKYNVSIDVDYCQPWGNLGVVTVNTVRDTVSQLVRCSCFFLRLGVSVLKLRVPLWGTGVCESSWERCAVSLGEIMNRDSSFGQKFVKLIQLGVLHSSLEASPL